MAYYQDNKKSKKKEAAFEALLKERNNLTENSGNGYAPWWDISCTSSTGTISTFEIKYNSNYGGSNKAIIETCRIIDEIKHPSGLSLSTSNYYVLTFENDSTFYIIPTDKLKELVASTTNKKEIHYDEKGYQLAIFQKDWLLSFAYKL